MLSQKALEQHLCQPLPASGLLAILGAPWLVDRRSNLLCPHMAFVPMCVSVCLSFFFKSTMDWT